MKRYSVLVGIFGAAIACSSLPAQEKPAIQPNATVLSVLHSDQDLLDILGLSPVMVIENTAV